jgi:AAA domain
MSRLNLAPYMAGVAKLLLGEPNKQLSKKDELRYGTRGSLAINLKDGTFFNHETLEGGGVLKLIELKTGRTGAARIDWLRDNGFDVTPNGSIMPQIVEVYDYVDESGRLLSQVVRFEPKDFRQRKPDGKGGWTWNVRGVRRVPYRLVEMLEAISLGQLIVICEGEKDCNILARQNVVTTTNPGGASSSKNGKSKWSDELTPHFKDADVVIIPDNDSVGRAHVEHVAAKLRPVVKRVRILDLANHWADCPIGGDVSNWLSMGGGTREKLDALIAGAKDWAPPHAGEAPDYCGAESTKTEDKALPLIWTVGEDPSGSGWIYDGLLPKIGAGLVSGQTGVGKTSVLVDLGGSITDGHSFAGRPIERKGGVLLLATEGQHGLPRRLRALVKAGKLSEQTVFPRAESCPRLLEEGALEILLATARAAEHRLAAQYRVQLDLICLDTLGAAAGWTDEDDAAEAIRVMGVLLELANKMKCCVAAADHFGKTISSGTRGASPKEDRSDFVLALLGDRQLSGAFRHRRMAIRKMRDGPSGMEIPYELRPIALDGNKTSCVVDWLDQRSAGATPDKWTKSLHQFHLALTNALAEHGTIMRPWHDGPEVRAVDIERVRQEFSERYIANSGDVIQRRDACRKAFTRAAQSAQDRGLVGVRVINGEQWIWVATDKRAAE